jgi:hypothetical protein
VQLAENVLVTPEIFCNTIMILKTDWLCPVIVLLLQRPLPLLELFLIAVVALPSEEMP